MTIESVKKGSDETDEISRLLGGMPRVGVPANFDAGVKRRIAESRNRQANWWPAHYLPRFAAAAVAVFLFGVIFVFWMKGPDGGDSISISAEKNSPRNAENMETVDLKPDISPKAPSAKTDSFDNGKPESTEMAAASGKTEVPPPDKKTSKSRRAKTQGGSVIRALRANPERTFPKGIRTSPSTEPGDEIDVGAALAKLGIESRFDGGWQVIRVFPDSLAAASGVQKGDVIGAINDNAVDQSSRIPVGQRIEKLSLRRQGQALVVQIAGK